MGSQNNIICSTDLTLGFGYSSSSSSSYNHLTNYISKPKTTPAAASKLLSVIFEPPSLNLTLSASSYQSNAAAKREREMMSINVKAEEGERVIGSRVLIISDEEYEDNNGVNVRKKHRLSKSQSALLEQSFRHHTTLNPVQKQRLARELNLRPRQVEVWFQNRRARTKLKQIEAEYEVLKKCCETLTDENKRLRKEVQELKALKLMKPTSFYMQLPPPPPPAAAAALNKCPSCGGGGSGGCKTTTKRSSFTMGPTTTHFSNPVNSPSAA